jgi:hypothetical protein
VAVLVALEVVVLARVTVLVALEWVVAWALDED